MSLTEIAELCGVSRARVGDWANRYNLRETTQPYRNKEWLERRYCKQRLSNSDIAQEAKCGYSTIGQWVRNHGLTRRRTTDSLNETYFSEIDNTEKAYWLGFLAADGCVCNKPGKRLLSVGLAPKDTQHLKLLRKAVGSDRQIYRSANVVRIQLFSEQLVNDLISHGVVPRKSLILEPPNIDDDLVSHWIRGYFDGDGSVSIRGGKYLRGDVVGTQKVLNFVAMHCSSFSLPTEHGNYWLIRFQSRNAAAKLAGYLYNDSGVCLERKRDIFFQILKK